MAISRDDLKAMRLKAMAVVGTQMDASAAMFDRLIAAGQKVTDARTAAETAHMGAIDAQVADLNEMAQEFTDMGNAAAPASTVTAKPAPTGALLGPAQSQALAALMAAQPNPVKPQGPGQNGSTLSAEAMAKGDAFFGTHGEFKP
jgi:hypothetical protein